MYNNKFVGYLEAVRGGPRGRVPSCKYAWETLAHFVLIAHRMGDIIFSSYAFSLDQDERCWACALPGLRAIQLAYSLPGVKLDFEFEHDHRIIPSFIEHVVQAWAERGKYEDYMLLEDELPQQFKFDLLKFKIGLRDNDQGEADDG